VPEVVFAVLQGRFEVGVIRRFGRQVFDGPLEFPDL